MKKALLLAAVVAMIAGSTAVAQDSVLWMDIRDNTSPFQSISAPVNPYTNGQGDEYAGPDNLGMEGDGQVLRISPKHADAYEQGKPGWPNLDADNDTSTGDLWLYMTVLDNDDPTSTGDVISSLGVDINVSDAGAGAKNRIDAATFDFAWEAGVWGEANAGSVNGNSDGGDPPSWLGAKGVKVPVVAGPLYDVGAGMTPGNTYRVGKLHVEGGLRNCNFGVGHKAASTFNVFLSVNDLLITRVCETGGDAFEEVSFGYSAGAPETPPVNGSTSGAMSADPDAIIIIEITNDTTGDGRVFGNDIPGFTGSVGAAVATQWQAFLHDVNGDRQVFGNDIPGFTNSVTASATCP
jgi:hypothetical protein